MSHGASLYLLQSKLGLFCGGKCIKNWFLVHERSCEISSACGRWSQECVELQSGCAQFCSAFQLWNQSIPKIAASFWVLSITGSFGNNFQLCSPASIPGKALPEPVALAAEANQGSTVFTPNTTNRFIVTSSLVVFMPCFRFLLMKGSGGLQICSTFTETVWILRWSFCTIKSNTTEMNLDGCTVHCLLSVFCCTLLYYCSEDQFKFKTEYSPPFFEIHLIFPQI